MTYEEALEIFKEYIDFEEGYINEYKAEKLAIKAIEKQIAKKPHIWGDGYADGALVYDMYDCPNCDKSYEIDYEKHDYCPKCGQRIDWSDWSEE